MKLPKKTLDRIRKTKRKDEAVKLARLQEIASLWTRQVVGSVKVSAVSKPDALATRNEVG